jgi:large subunit ribosomal protein L21e
MLAKTKGYRRRTRSLLRKRPREHGKLGLSRLLHEYKPGDKTVIIIDSAVHNGMPHRRYHGRVGVIIGKKGRAFEISVSQGNVKKEIFVRPEHLKPYKER